VPSPVKLLPNATVQGDLLYGSAASTWTQLAKDTNSTRYLSNTGASNSPAWAQVALTTGVTGTLPIANGGTNAASFTASNGIVTYNGSALVNYASPTIDSSGRYFNTTQPGTTAYGASGSNLTGDGTTLTIINGSEVFDNNSNYSTSTGVFTCTVAGQYLVSITVTLDGVGAGHTEGNIYVVCADKQFQNKFNPANLRNASNQCTINMNVIVTIPGGTNGIEGKLSVTNSTKTVGLVAGAGNDAYNYMSVYKLG